MDSITLVFKPLTNDEIPMTTTTPITMPKNRQPRAQLVATDRVQRHLENFAVVAPFHSSNLKAVMGSSRAARLAG